MLNNVRGKLIKLLGGKMGNEINKLQGTTYDIRKSKNYIESLQEAKCWLDDDINQLEQFYGSRGTYFFWDNSAINKKEWGFKKFHFPTVSLLNKKLINVVFKNGIEFPEDKRFNEVAEYNKLESKVAQNVLSDINIYGGSILKYGLNADDKEITIESYDPLNVIFVKEARDITEIHFYNVYDKYTLKEIYYRGGIRYEAYKNDSGIECSVSEIDEGLEDIEFGNDFMAARFIKGFGDNPYDPQRIMGRGAFFGLYSSLDDIDKQYSILSKESTAAMSVDKYPMGSMVTIKDGDNIKQVQPSQFMKSFSTYNGNGDSMAPSVDQRTFNSQEYIILIENLFNSILQAVGISAQTINANNSSANASGAAKQEDEKLTVDTRDERVSLMKVALEDIYEDILTWNDILNTSFGLGKESIKELNGAEISFGDYYENNIDDWLSYVTTAEALGALDRNTVIELVASLLNLDEKKVEELKLADEDNEPNYEKGERKVDDEDDSE